jgi:multidrug resistance efflux pump
MVYSIYTERNRSNTMNVTLKQLGLNHPGLKGLLAAAVIAAGALCTAGSASADTIRLSTTVSDSSNWVKAANKFKELVEERSGAKHKVEVYANGTLVSGNDRVELEMAQAGAIDIIMKSTPWLSQLNPDFVVVSMPWIFPNTDAAMAVMDGPVGDKLSAKLETQGIRALAWGSGSFFQLYTNPGPIETVDDISGVKIRTPGLELYLDSWSAIGSVPVAMSFAEVFTALQAGAIVRSLIDAWQDRGRIGDSQLAHDELAFLPAALEIQAKPPSPAGRLLMWSLIILFVIGVLWACFGRVDIVAIAEGKIVPSGKVKPIQPLEKGVVSRILVKEGERVSRGQVLVELDTSQTNADRQRLEYELLAAGFNLARQQAMIFRLSRRGEPEESIEWPGQSTVEQRQLHQSLFNQQWSQYRAQIQALEHALGASRAEQDTSLARIQRLKSTLPLNAERADALKQLSERKMAARLQYLEIEEARVENQQELVEEGARQRQLQSAMEEIAAQLKALEAKTGPGPLKV